MKKKSIEFLNELKEELNSQDPVGQAHPRFWVIMDYKWEPTADGCGERLAYFMFDVNENTSIKEEEVIDELLAYMGTEKLEETIKEATGWEGVKEFKRFYDTWYLDELLDCINFPCGYVKAEEILESYIVPNTLFFTNREAKEHLEKNKHHYSSKAHAYAMTALRSPQMEKLMNILMTEDFGE